MAVRWMLGAVAVAVVALAVFAGTTQASGGSFTGAWAAPDTDGDLVLLEISGAGGHGLRRFQRVDQNRPGRVEDESGDEGLTASIQLVSIQHSVFQS